ncbi:hypothetical protein CVT24_006425 [Panaeolus cyanescens]|uniref:Prenylcysteine lyase domain-containing protein n=1 Tax=Panaeolus cyanescens TaxID=181874 RepID=A0A409WI11_9AGAR|nr:hypothetical protein CVT24_006425 [Panaeolus cyanescens]
MERRLRQSSPRITARIKFVIEPLPPLPVISQRTRFDTKAMSKRNKGTFDEHSDRDFARGRSTSPPEDDRHPRRKRPRSPSHPPPQPPSTSHSSPNDLPLIPKPPGEPGRPGSGGYTLDVALKDLGQKTIDKINEYVKRKADIHLNIALSFSQQNNTAVTDLIRDVRDQFHELKRYENDWPIRDILKGYLKYKSGRIRQGLEEPPAGYRPSKRQKPQKKATFAPGPKKGTSNDHSDFELEDDPESEEETAATLFINNPLTYLLMSPMQRYFLQPFALSVVVYAVLFATDWFKPSSTSTLSSNLENPPQRAAPLKIAIIGAGAGGSSAAFWISKAMKRSNLSASIDVYEQSSYIGGRSLSVDQPGPINNFFPYNLSVELGAHTFEDSHRHMWRAAFEFNLPVATVDSQDKAMHFWDGLKLVVCSPLPVVQHETNYTPQRMSPSFWPIVDFLQYHGCPSFTLGSGFARAQQVATKFAEVYQKSFSAWYTPLDLVQRLGFEDLLTNKTSNYFLQTGASKSLIDGMIAPLLPGYIHDQTHSLQSLFHMTPSSLYQIPGGTRRIFENFIESSSASLFLNTTVKCIDRVAGSQRWRVNTTSNHTEYDFVILAAPFHQANIVVPQSLSKQVPLVTQQDVHVTVVLTQTPSLNTTFLGLPSFDEGARYVNASHDVKIGQGVFSSLSYWKQGPDLWLVNIKSQAHLSDEWVACAFTDGVKVVHRHKWQHLRQVPTLDFSPIRLEEGFYYLNTFESVLSSMETQIVTSLNVVNLLLNDAFSTDVCGNTSATPAHGFSKRYSVVGWDC